MNKTLQNLVNSIRFGIFLISAFNRPWSHEKAAIYIRQGIDRRASNFIRLCDSQIFANPRSPYLHLFKSAGYTRDRMVSNISKLGLEKTLMDLAAEGVYLDIDEFKGKKTVIRPGLRMTIDATDLDIVKGPSISLKSSGSRGPGMKTRISISGLNLLTSCIPPIFKYMQAEHLPVVLFYPMPSVSGIIHLILFTMAGKPPHAWFSQILNAPLWRSQSGLKLSVLLILSRLMGLSLPSPQFSNINHPVVMARWLADNCSEGAVVSTFTGSALHLVQAAGNANISLPRLLFILGGEPVTEKKRRILETAGHQVFVWYSSVETGRIAISCLSPAYSDDMHLLNDRVAGIIHQRKFNPADSQRSALLLTAVHPDMYKFFLNVETGDEAVIANRPCGCPWEALGLRFHIHSVQSYEKLTLEGMSIVVDNIFRFIEEELPARCGGTPVDYQFTEEENMDGITRLVLSVSPTVPTETDKIREVLMSLFLELPNTAFAAALLNQASAFLVRREYPKLTRSGKILALRSGKKGVPS